MQCQAAKTELPAKKLIVLAVAVIGVSHERMANMSEMLANLMQSPRERLGQRKRIAGRGIAAHREGQLHARETLKTRLCAALGPARLVGEGMIDQAFVGQEAAHQRHVTFLDEALPEQLAPNRRAFRAEREEQDTARAPVEAVHRVDEKPELSAQKR